LEGADLPTFQILSGDESGFDFRDKNYNYEVQSAFM